MIISKQLQVILTCAVVVIAGISGNSEAVSINVPPTLPPTFGVSGFGGIEPYRGETFTALTAHPETLTVFVGSAEGGNLPFHILLTEISTSGGLHPTTVLFESSTLTIPLLSPLAPFAVDLSTVLLVPGQKYAWILDAFVTGAANPFFGADTGYDPTASFADGVPLSFIGGPIIQGTRSDHFAPNPNWFSDPQIDFAFSLSFSEGNAAPEPSTWLLLGSGLAGLAAWRKKKAA